jgi:3-hydroxybutyryl-CoA dehydratase
LFFHVDSLLSIGRARKFECKKVGKGDKKKRAVGRNFSVSGIRSKALKGLRVGDAFSITRTFTEEDVIRFADITRDYNPVHFEERFSGAKNFWGWICHGLLVASMISEIGGQIGWLASETRFQFEKPVYIGETISCSLTITNVAREGRSKPKGCFATRNRRSSWRRC